MIAEMDRPPQLLVDRPTAARLLALSEREVYTKTRNGQIPSIKLGQRSVRYSVRQLEDWIAKQAGG